MAANPIPEAAVDALYDELFRVGRYLHAPVPIDPKGIIRRHLAAAQQQGQATPPSAPVGVDAPGSRAWMAEVCRAAALSLAAHGVRNDQLSKVADWITQQPAAVDEAMAESFCRRWYEITGRSLERAHVLASLDTALTAQHQEPSDG